MKFPKKIIAATLTLLVLGGGSAAYASAGASSLAVLADAADTSVDTILENREDGETLGSIAAEYGVLAEFQEARLADRIALIQEKVEEGTLTQDEADEIIATMEDHLADCDGTGTGSEDGTQLNLQLGQQGSMGSGTQNQVKSGTQNCTQSGECTMTASQYGTGGNGTAARNGR